MSDSAGKLYIDGSFVDAADGATELVREKATGEAIGRYAVATSTDVDRAVRSARAAQPTWAAALPAERAAVLRRAGDLLGERAAEFTERLIRETGGVWAKAAGEVTVARNKFYESAALHVQPAGDIGPSFKPGKLQLLQRIPLGVVAAITPWNFPLVLALRPVGRPWRWATRWY